MLSPFHLARLRLTQPQYAALAKAQARPARAESGRSGARLITLSRFSAFR